MCWICSGRFYRGVGCSTDSSLEGVFPILFRLHPSLQDLVFFLYLGFTRHPRAPYCLLYFSESHSCLLYPFYFKFNQQRFTGLLNSVKILFTGLLSVVKEFNIENEVFTSRYLPRDSRCSICCFSWAFKFDLRTDRHLSDCEVPALYDFVLAKFKSKRGCTEHVTRLKHITI